jgi:hypothetical protein
MGFVTKRFIPGYRTIDGSDLNAMIDQINSGPGSGPTYYVNQTIGSDVKGNDGFNPYSPLKTLDRALELEDLALDREGLASVGRNAVVAFWGTQSRTSTLAWALPGTHLVGLCAPLRRGKRARISVTGSTGFNKLVAVTGAGCEFSNFGTLYGWADTSAALLAWSDEIGRSSYDNVEFMGFGDNTASTGSANLTGSRALKFTGANGESTWKNCVFGVDTTDRNATNYTVEIAGAAARLTFEDCVWEARLGASGGSSSHLLIGASGIDRYVDIVRGRFHNFSTTAMSQVLNISASAGGTVLLDQSTFAGGTAWQTSPGANVVMNMTIPTTGGGKAIQNA